MTYVLSKRRFAFALTLALSVSVFGCGPARPSHQLVEGDQAASTIRQGNLDALAALPQDRIARFIVAVDGAGDGDARLARAEHAAREAGAISVARVGSQPLLVVEATPAQMRRLMASGTIVSAEIDRATAPEH